MNGSLRNALAVVVSLAGLFASEPLQSSAQGLSGHGHLMVHAVDATTGRDIPNAEVRIVFASQDSATSGQTDVTGMTAPGGLTQPFQFPAPARPAASQPGSIYWSNVNVTVSAPGYETFVDNGVKILDQQIGTEEALMIPVSGTFTATTPLPAPFFVRRSDAQPFEAQNAAPTGTPTLNASPQTGASPQVPCCGNCTQPASITVHFGAPSCYNCANISYSFSDYVKHALAGEWIPSWGDSANGMASLDFGAIAVRTFANDDIWTCKWRCQGRNFDITTDPGSDQSWSSTTYANTDTATADTPHLNFQAPERRSVRSYQRSVPSVHRMPFD